MVEGTRAAAGGPRHDGTGSAPMSRQLGRGTWSPARLPWVPTARIVAVVQRPSFTANLTVKAPTLPATTRLTCTVPARSVTVTLSYGLKATP